MKLKWIPAACVTLVVSMVLLGASDAHAERIVLLKFSGQKAAVVREKVAASLKRAGHKVIRSGVSPRGIGPKTLKRVGKNADAVLGGRVDSARKGNWKVTLSVSDPKAGTPLGEEMEFASESSQGLTKELSDVAERVEALMGGNEPPAPVPAEIEPAPEPIAEPPAVEAKIAASPEMAAEGDSADAEMHDEPAGEDADSTKGKRALARLTVRAGYTQRDFDFSEDIYDHLRKQVSKVWVYRAEGKVFPFRGDIGERLGFIASYEGKLSGSVDDVDFQVSYPVLHSELFAGVRARHPMGENELSGDLGVGRMEAGLDDANGAANIPDLQYTFLRASADYQLNVGAFDVTGAIGLRLPLGFGEVSETRWFPRVGGYGAEAGIAVGYPLSSRVSLDAAGSLRRYVLNMNSEPEDALTGASQVAGGAVDLFASIYFGVSVTL